MATSLRVALAAQDAAERDTLTVILARLGHQVVVTEGGTQLREHCQDGRPDLIVIDLTRAEGNSLEAACRLTQEWPTPILLVSDSPQTEILAQLGPEPVMGYLIKPVSETNLKTAVTVAMLRFQHFLSLQKEAAELRQALEDRKVVERAKGILMHRLRLDEEEAFLRLRLLACQENEKLVEVARKVEASDQIFSTLETVVQTGQPQAPRSPSAGWSHKNGGPPEAAWGRP